MAEKFNFESLKFEYPRYCDIDIVLKIPPDSSEPFYQSSKISLEEELKEGKIQELETVNEEIIAKLRKEKNNEYLIPDSIVEISDYFPPSPYTYKFFINITSNKENYRNKVLICGYKSGLELKPKFKKRNEYLWSIFSRCWLLEKDNNNEVKIYELKIRLIKDRYGRIKKIKLISTLIPENAIQNENLRETLTKFKKGEIKQDEG